MAAVRSDVVLGALGAATTACYPTNFGGGGQKNYPHLHTNLYMFNIIVMIFFWIFCLYCKPGRPRSMGSLSLLPCAVIGLPDPNDLVSNNALINDRQ